MLKMSPNAVGGCLQMRWEASKCAGRVSPNAVGGLQMRWEVSKCAGRMSPNAEDKMSSFEVKLIRLISLTLSGKHLN